MKRTLLALLGGAFVLNVPASAHHSFAASYFEEQSVTIEGEIVEFQLRNPHCWLYIMAPDENGEMQKFGAEWANASRLRQSGMNEETLKPGDRVIITGSPGRKAEEHKIHLKSIARPADGWRWGGGGGRGGPGGRGAPRRR